MVAIFFSLVPVGCGSLTDELARIAGKQETPVTTPGSEAPVPAPTIAYGISATWFFLSTAITAITPTTTGNITSCTSSPTLPAGLAISATTCVISGTPTLVSGSTTYAITAAGADGSASTALTLRVANSTASRVYGQLGSFTCSVVSNNGACASGSISADNFNNPADVAVDSGGVYIVDRNNSRVLYFSGSSIAPTRVYGQFGNSACGVANNNGSCVSGGITANNLNIPEGVAADSAGVYIVDTTNNRVLHYTGTSTTADRVYGQNGNFSCSVANNNGSCIGGTVSANSLSGPIGVFLEAGGVYIADSANHRVLHYSGTSTTADRVYGQAGGFATATMNLGGTSATSLNEPVRGAADASGVYIADYQNNRVLHYSGSSTTADRVYGHSGNFGCGVANNVSVCSTGATNASNLNNPYGVALETNGVYIVDRVNNRITHYSGTSTTADRVYGQGGSLISSAINNGGLSAVSIFNPSGIIVDKLGLYVVDYSNQRALFY